MCSRRRVGAWRVTMGAGEITVDSAADESCWPKDLGGAFETKASRRNLILKTANGEEMKVYGEKDVTFKEHLAGGVMGLRSQVADVKKPLRAVRRLVDKNDIVQFWPEPDRNHACRDGQEGADGEARRVVHHQGALRQEVGRGGIGFCTAGQVSAAGADRHAVRPQGVCGTGGEEGQESV